MSGWRFDGELRHYQRDILRSIDPAPGEPLHLVAPPGAGKTLVGLLLAARAGHRAVALAPTTTIRHQWATTARRFTPDADQVSEDSAAVADLTVLTYQALSVVRTGDPVDDLARRAWLDELLQAGRNGEQAEEYLTMLARDNRSRYTSGIRRRHARLRKDLVRSDPAMVARVLHPSARDLVDRLVMAGVRTVVLDECHHLLDHWALVVGYLLGRIRESGHEPLVIGLTATLPSPEGDTAYETYTGLLGEVDYEIPTPAVVREGNLAPYRGLLWFTEPAPAEEQFLRTHTERLHELVASILATDDGIDYLREVLQPADPPAGKIPARARTAVGPKPPRRQKGQTSAPSAQRLGTAFDDDPHLAEACGHLLTQIAPDDAVVRLLPPAVRTPPTTEHALIALGRYALTRILPDPARAVEWEAVRATLADFGYQLTDRGIRRGRSPVDSLLATSTAKDDAAAHILRHELSGPDGSRVRAVVVCDFAVHGNKRGRTGSEPAGALRCFARLADDDTLAALRPVLLTAKHLRVRTADAELLSEALAARASERLGQRVTFGSRPVPHAPHLSDVDPGGVSPSVLVAAVSCLVADDVVRLLVGTRGLLGEGWDCPAVNTLVDLTTAATSSATQQLRGRTLRLDPAWPHKVAHNWSVVCLPAASSALDDSADLARASRKHDRLWGLSADDDTAVVNGLDNALTGKQQRDLGLLLDKRRIAGVPAVTADALNRATTRRLPDRETTWRRWRVGEDYVGAHQELLRHASDTMPPLLFSGPTVLAAVVQLLFLLGVPIIHVAAHGAEKIPSVGFLVWLFLATVVVLAVGGWQAVRDAWRMVRRRAYPATTYRAITLAVTDVLHATGRVPRFGPADIAVRVLDGGSEQERFEVSITGGEPDQQQVVLGAVGEILGPVRRPRFLLRVSSDGTDDEPSAPRRLLARLAHLVAPRSAYLPVPTLIGRRRADAQAFADAWRRRVGRTRLIEVKGPDAMATLAEARRRTATRAAGPSHLQTWY